MDIRHYVKSSGNAKSSANAKSAKVNDSSVMNYTNIKTGKKTKLFRFSKDYKSYFERLEQINSISLEELTSMQHSRSFYHNTFRNLVVAIFDYHPNNEGYLQRPHTLLTHNPKYKSFVYKYPPESRPNPLSKIRVLPNAKKRSNVTTDEDQFFVVSIDYETLYKQLLKNHNRLMRRLKREKKRLDNTKQKIRNLLEKTLYTEGLPHTVYPTLWSSEPKAAFAKGFVPPAQTQTSSPTSPKETEVLGAMAKTPLEVVSNKLTSTTSPQPVQVGNKELAHKGFVPPAQTQTSSPTSPKETEGTSPQPGQVGNKELAHKGFVPPAQTQTPSPKSPKETEGSSAKSKTPQEVVTKRFTSPPSSPRRTTRSGLILTTPAKNTKFADNKRQRLARGNSSFREPVKAALQTNARKVTKRLRSLSARLATELNRTTVKQTTTSRKDKSNSSSKRARRTKRGKT